MVDITTLKGLLFISYLTNYNLKTIHNIIRQGQSFFEREYFNKQDSVSIKRKQDALWITYKTIQKLKDDNIKAIPYNSSDYPQELKILVDYPPILYVKGELKGGMIAAVVGTRKASPVAPSKVKDVIRVLVEAGYGIVSGLALGIDTLAHEHTLDLKGYTIAVLPTAIETIYPAKNKGLAHQIVESGGALVSEIPLGIDRGKMGFIERDRLQAALSEYVLPIEMAVSSGTMHTVNFTIQQRKKLLLQIPDKGTLASYASYYEGITYLIAKHKAQTNPNILYYKNIEELKQITH